MGLIHGSNLMFEDRDRNFWILRGRMTNVQNFGIIYSGCQNYSTRFIFNFSAPSNAKEIANSDSSRENCFQQEYMKMKIIARLPKTGSPGNQNPSFSAPRTRICYFVQTT